MEPERTIRAVVADDEELGRERIRTMLSERGDIDVIAECADGRQTVDALLREQPDILFLDIRMPELDGFGVIEEIGAENMPATVFVTAYDEYAVRAFDVHAVDYLLKPFDADRFFRAIDRALARRRNRHTSEILADLTAEVQSGRRHPRHIAVRSRGRIDLVAIESIDWIGAAGNYVEIHADGDAHLLRQTMAAMEERLDTRLFIRIHRSTIVNIDRIADIHTMHKGEYEVRLVDGTKLTLSRSYRHRLDALIP